jgi:hypothetical protein
MFVSNQHMKQNTLIMIVALAAAISTGPWLIHNMDYALATSKLIDTSTGERTELRAGGVGQTAPGILGRAIAAPPAITGDNVYVAWWTNETGNDEVMFRASSDAGQTFGDRINLSNTTDADSTRVEIDSDADSVVVTWWETNQTSDTPFMKVSNDNGETFGPQLELATNGTIGEAETEE